MDPYIESYIDEVVNNTLLSANEVREILDEYVRDEDIILHLVEYNNTLRTVPEKTNPRAETITKAIGKEKRFSELDHDIKHKILQKYDLSEIRNTAVKVVLPEFIDHPKKLKHNIRYHNNIVVTNKGEKYV